MREIITLHIGEAGIQVGNKCWELYCLEHGIGPDGYKINTGCTSDKNSEIMFEGNPKTFFQINDSGKCVPRSAYIDLEPSAINSTIEGNYGKLFHPDSMISGTEDAANNFARGYYTTGKELIPQSLDQLRIMIEACSSFQGFLVFNSVGGGTGSGFCSQLLEQLSSEYNKKSKISFTIFPSAQMAPAVVEPYNTVLSVDKLLEHTDITMMLDNESIYDICKKGLGNPQPKYSNLNRIISQTASSITTSLRFPGALNVDLNEFQTNLVPFPRIHFMTVAYAPIISASKANHERFDVSQLTNRAFAPSSSLCKIDAVNNRYMSACLMYRGDINPEEVNRTVTNLKTKETVKFVDWCPTGFKSGINNQPPKFVPGGDLAESKRALTLISNNTGVKDVFKRYTDNFDMMFKKRAFVHWYVMEGMEEGEFSESRENLGRLQNDYIQISGDAEDGEEFSE